MSTDSGSNNQHQGRKKNIRIQTQLTGIMLNNEQINYRQYTRNKTVKIQTQLTGSMIDDYERIYRQHELNPEVGTNNNSWQNFDRGNISSSGEQTRDPRQVVVATENYYNIQNDSRRNNRCVVEPSTEERNSRPTKVIDDFETLVSPIAGYDEEPLLPLTEACAPLSEILHNLSFYVQLASKETPEEPPDGLTIDESAAIRLYTIEWEAPHRSLYSMLNYHLKNTDRENLLPYFKYIKLFLTALVKLPCVPPLTIWRGVTRNLSGDFPAGTRVTWWAFSSCTTEMTVLENNMYLGSEGDRTLFSVEAINGRTIKNHSHFVTEDELLLLPGTHMIVQSQLSPAPSLHIIHLKQVIPEEVLLEPPFEGI
jgi:hypothetical protein